MANKDIEACIFKVIDDYLAALDGESDAEGIYRLIMSEVETALISYALEHHNYNQTQASQWLGIARNSLRKKISEYHLGQ